MEAPHIVANCEHLPAPGTWENITPPNFKGLAMVINPNNQAIVYVGGNGTGIQKTTDCGSTWSHVNTGLGQEMDKGLQGSMVIDPVDPNILYADARYGPNGLWKTTDGGVNWRNLYTDDIAKVFENNGMTESVAMDPTDHLHLIVSPHFMCQNGHSQHCLLETTDGGNTFKVIEDTPPAGEFSGVMVVDRKTWLVAMPFDGLYRTGDSGATWQQVHKGYAYGIMMRGGDGTYYVTGFADGLLQSKDTIEWGVVPGSPHAVALAGDDTVLYTHPHTQAPNPISTVPINNPEGKPDSPRVLGEWKEIPYPSTEGVWALSFDTDHNILYSAGFVDGTVWRIVMGPPKAAPAN